MQLIDGEPVYSATDLVGFLACESLTALERSAMAGLAPLPYRRYQALEIVQKRGFERERRYLEELRVQGKVMVAIEADLQPYPFKVLQEQGAAAAIASPSRSRAVCRARSSTDASWRASTSRGSR